MTDLRRLRGLRALLEDAVKQGSIAIERVQIETAARTFAVLEAIPPIAGPSKVVRVLHNSTVSAVHLVIREVNHVVGVTLDAALDVAERAEETPGPRR